MRLTTRETGLVRSLSHTLLAPLTFASDAAWRRAVLDGLMDLTGAARSHFVLPGSREPAVGVNMDPAMPAAWAGHFHALDHGPARRRELGLEVCAQREIYAEDLPRTELYHDFLLPYGLVGGIAVNEDLGAGPDDVAWMGASIGDPAGAEAFERRFRAALCLLQPAFSAGVRTAVGAAGAREALARLMDEQPVPMLVATTDGRERYRNRALRAFLAGEPERKRLLRAARRLARALGEATSSAARRRGRGLEPRAGTRTVRLSRCVARVHPSLVGEGVLGGGPYVLVTFELPDLATLDAAALARRHGLTPREAEVCLHLVRGATTKGVARDLGISPATAARHVEAVLRKLGVSSRAAVAARISGAAPE